MDKLKMQTPNKADENFEKQTDEEQAYVWRIK